MLQMILIHTKNILDLCLIKLYKTYDVRLGLSRPFAVSLFRSYVVSPFHCFASPFHCFASLFRYFAVQLFRSLVVSHRPCETAKVRTNESTTVRNNESTKQQKYET